MGTSGAFIAICVSAIAEGGPGLLATLVVISSLFQFALAWRLSLLRRILTPTVAGTVITLIPVTVMPIVFDMLTQVPDGDPGDGRSAVRPHDHAGHMRYFTVHNRHTAPVGTGPRRHHRLSGCQLLRSLRYRPHCQCRVGRGSRRGLARFRSQLRTAFWALLPAFVFVTLVGAIETIGDGIAIQRVSWRKPRAVDFRAVQGAVAADGMGNLLSGLGGTVPNTTYSTSIAVTALTGVGARRVGIALGSAFILMAFLPKVLAMVLAIPSPVAAAYITVLLALLFVVGMKIIVQDGMDYRKGLIAGVAFWTGAGFQNELIFPELVSGFAGGLLQNGITAGGLVAILLTLFLELTAPRRRRIQVDFNARALPKIREFLLSFASHNGWDGDMTHRLDAAAEETLLTLLQQDEGEFTSERRRLLLTAYKENGGAILEFIAASGEENLQDRIALLSERQPMKCRWSGRSRCGCCAHLASSVHHQQYHDATIVTIRVNAPVASQG